MRSTTQRSSFRTPARASAITLAAIGLVAAGALLVVNLMILPRAVSRLSAAASTRFSLVVEQTGALYLPAVGLVLRNLTIARPASSSGAAFTVRARRMRVTVPPGILRSGADPLVPAGTSLNTRNLGTAVPAALDRARKMRLLPRLIRVSDVSVSVGVPGATLPPVTFDQLDFRTGARTGTSILAGAGASAELRAAVSHGPTADGPPIAILFRVSGFPLSTDRGSASIPAAEITATSRANDWIVGGRIAADDARVVAPTVADEPIDGLSVAIAFETVFSPSPVIPPPYRRHPGALPVAFPVGSVQTARGSLTVGSVTVEVRPAVDGLLAGPRTIRALAGLAPTPVQEILDAVPAQVSGDLATAELEGTFGLEFDLRVPLDSISDMKWDASTSLDEFAVTALSPAVNVYKLMGGFDHTIRDDEIDFEKAVRIPVYQPASMQWMLLHSEHTARQILRSREEDSLILASRPPVRAAGAADALVETDRDGDRESPDYTRLDDISPWVVRAVLTGEDGDFFFYRGVNPVTLVDAIEINLREGEILYGASTISMQLVKMMFLETERVFARKLQELFLVYLMENHVPVPKDRIMELYLNLAEFGPGVFGIRDAARHYFAKDPARLTAGEATWLATVLPAPKLYSRDFAAGRVSDEQYERMVRLYNIMLKRGRMTPAEHAAALRSRPTFADP